MRLIDEDKLIARFKQLKGPDILLNIFISDVIKVIKQMPTAYDIDKVVERLEEHKSQYCKLQLAHNDKNMICVYVGKEQAVDCAIEIVKQGGVADDVCKWELDGVLILRINH